VHGHLRHPPPRAGIGGTEDDEQVGILPAAVVVPAAIKAVRTTAQVVQQLRRPPPQAPGPRRAPAAASPRPFSFRGEDTMPSGQPNNASGYLGADDFENGQAIGYDEDDLGWQEEDNFLAGVDAELEAIEAEDDAEEVGDDDEIGDDEIGRRMGRRARRIERAERVEEKVKRRLDNVPAHRRKRRRRLLNRKGRAEGTQQKLLDRQERKAQKRALRKGGGKASKRAAALAAGGAAAGAAGAGLAMSRRRGSGDNMQDVFLDLPPQGKLVRVPFLVSGSEYADLSMAIAAGATSTDSQEMATAGITYAKLKVRGFVARFTAKAAVASEGNIHTWLNSGKVDGGIDLFYGKQLGIVEWKTTTLGDGVVVVGSVRDDSIIHRNQVARVTVGATQFGALTGALALFAQCELICETIDDPMAEHNA
jgi:hypothetical protein